MNNFYRVKCEDRNFKIIKSEKSADAFEVIMKVKGVSEVLKAVRGLKTWKTNVRKIPENGSFFPYFLVFFSGSSGLQNKYGAFHT